VPIPLAEVLADLRREPGVERLALAGLDEANVAAFVEAAAGHAIDADDLAVVREIHTETEGNPFFVGEVLRHLTETGAMVQRDGRWTIAGPVSGLGIPEGVREVVGRRLARLPGAVNEVLAVAAVMGREFDVGLLTAATRVDEDGVLDALERAEEAHLIASVPIRPDCYAFSHALVRATLYDDLPTTRRLRLHRRIGRALEGRPDAEARVVELARHFGEAAGLGEMDRAVVYARRAGDRARAELALEEAAAHYERALAALELTGRPDATTRCDLQIALGDTLQLAGDPRHRAVLLEAAARARALDDAWRLGEVVVALNPRAIPSAMGRMDAEIVNLAEDALSGLGVVDSALRARVIAVLAVELTFASDQKRRNALIREAIDIARRVGDRAALAWVLVGCIWCARDPDGLEEMLAWADELVALGEELDNPEFAFWGHIFRHDGRLGGGDVLGATADLKAAEELAGQLRQPLSAWRVAVRRAGEASRTGRLNEAETLAVAGLQFSGEAIDESWLTGVLAAHLFLLRYEQGRLAEVEETLAGLANSQPQLVLWRAWLAVVYCETQRPAQARMHLEALTADGLTQIPRDYFWWSVVAALGSVAATLEDHGRSQLFYEALVPYSGRVVSHGPLLTGPVDLTLGVLATTIGRYDDAERHFAASADLCQHMEAPAWLGRTRRAWARMLHRRSGPGDALRARQLSGQTPRRRQAAPALPGGLTEREAEVIRLVAKGKANREIAVALCLSDRTVARHLSNIFTKLGVNSRAAATVFAQREGIA
jgi:DNA-binding CsgD family transcriptional regulator/tetratricopeptide (TPR) repeat protein